MRDCQAGGSADGRSRAEGVYANMDVFTSPKGGVKGMGCGVIVE